MSNTLLYDLPHIFVSVSMADIPTAPAGYVSNEQDVVFDVVNDPLSEASASVFNEEEIIVKDLSGMKKWLLIIWNKQ